MSFYLGRLEAARRQRTVAEAAAVHAPPPHAWNCYQQRHAALLPRPPRHPPPLHAGGVGEVRGGGRDTWRGGSVAARAVPPVGAVAAGENALAASGAGGWVGVGARGMAGSVETAPVAVARSEVTPISATAGVGAAGWEAVASRCAGGLAGDSSVALAREDAGEVGAGEQRNKRCLLALTPDALCPPPKRRAVPARRRFPPGCGRDAMAAVPLRVPAAGDDSPRSVPARRDGGSGALQESPPPALAGGKDSILFEAAASPRVPAAAGPIALNKMSATDGAAGATTTIYGAHHSPEAPDKNSAAAPDALCNATGPRGVAGPAGGIQLLENKDCLVPSVRSLPKPRMVSAYRRFPPGCRRALPTGSQVCSPSSPEAVPTDRDVMEIVAPEIQQSPSATLHDEAASRRHGTFGPGISAVEAYASHASSSDEEMIGNTWQCDENKSGGSSCDVVSESLAPGLPDEHLSGERVSECATPDTAWSGVAAGVPGQGAMLRKKVMLTPRKSVKPPKSIQKPAPNTQWRPFSEEAEEMTELGIGRHTANGIQDSDEFTKDPAMQDSMSSDKCPWKKGKEAATIGDYYFGPKKKAKVKGAKLEDDEIFKAIAVNEGKFEHGPQDADARSKVKMICSKFESICRAIVQAVDQRSLKVRRIDLAADKLIRKLPGFTKLGPVVGDVPGVEIGDEFLYRVELALVGLHRPYQGGIDTTRDEHGTLIAISVVASGGYPDESSCSGELIYTGSGKKGDGDQKLKHGNLALRNCIERKTPVRVIHGFKGLNREGLSHSRAREVSTFAYDGLYHVVECWKEGRPGMKVFKYKLQRIPGQPGPSLHMAKFVRKNKNWVGMGLEGAKDVGATWM